jgi:tetratricopeptide (TPR) repeat protein
MMSEESDQGIDFLIKRAEYSARLAGLHFRGNEFDKAINLYREAYNYLKKALENRPDDSIIANKMEEIKKSYDQARDSYVEHSQNAEPASEPSVMETEEPPVSEPTVNSEEEGWEQPVQEKPKKKGFKKKSK